MRSMDEVRMISHSWDGPKSLCKCGHSGDGSPSAHSNRPIEMGHGRCLIPGCTCMRFTWSHWTEDFREATE